MDPSRGAGSRHRLRRASCANPQARVTAAQFETLSGYAMQELDDEALGWFSAPAALGQLRHAVPRLAELARPRRGHQALVPPPPPADRGHRASSSRWRAAWPPSRSASMRALGALREFCLVSNLRFLHGYACWAIDSRVSLRAASFPFEAPPHRDAYPLMFGGELHFGAERGQLQLRRALPGAAAAARRARAAHHAAARAAADGAAVPARPAAGPARARAAARAGPAGGHGRGAGAAAERVDAARCTASCWRKASRCRR